MENLIELQKRSVELKRYLKQLVEGDSDLNATEWDNMYELTFKEEAHIAWRIRTIKYLNKVNFQW